MDGFAFVEQIRARPGSARHARDPGHLAQRARGQAARQRRRRAGLRRQERIRPGANCSITFAGWWREHGPHPRPRRRRLADGARRAVRRARRPTPTSSWSRWRATARRHRAVRGARPDVVTMDMMLPVMSGLAATEYIMAHTARRRSWSCRPRSIAASCSRCTMRWPPAPSTSSKSRAATSRSASGSDSSCRRSSWCRGSGSSPIRARAFAAAAVGAATVPRATVCRADQRSRGHRRLDGRPGRHRRNPARAAADLRRCRSSSSSTSIRRSARAFADWLDAQTGWRCASPAMASRSTGAAGRVVMAPPGRHLVVKDGRLQLDDGPERYSCRPSVDVLFESVAPEYGGHRRRRAC